MQGLLIWLCSWAVAAPGDSWPLIISDRITNSSDWTAEKAAVTGIASSSMAGCRTAEK